MPLFTPEELEELRKFDEEIDREVEENGITPEEVASSVALDRFAAHEDLDPVKKRTASRRRRYYIRNAEKLKRDKTAYYAAHREELREKARAYRAAHRDEINARKRARYEEKKNPPAGSGADPQAGKKS